MIDLQSEINALERSVGADARRFEAGEARIVRLVRTYAASIEDVWDACTNPQRIPRWFLPVSGELRVGGRYQLQGNAGGSIERCDPPRGFAATWEYGGEVSWLELTLSSDADGRTRFQLEHIAPVDARWLEFGPGAVGIGWDLGLRGLSKHLATGQAVDPAAATAWMTSDEGRLFMFLSSERWRDASIAAGTDPAEAAAAARRTIAFYTGADAA